MLFAWQKHLNTIKGIYWAAICAYIAALCFSAALVLIEGSVLDWFAMLIWIVNCVFWVISVRPRVRHMLQDIDKGSYTPLNIVEEEECPRDQRTKATAANVS